MGDNPHLLAELSTILSRRRSYLPVLDGPRMTRPDADAEVIRRTNVVARLRPHRVVLAGLPDATSDFISANLPRDLTIRITSADQLPNYLQGVRFPRSEFQWGREHIGLGVLRALRGGQKIIFRDFESPADGVGLDSDHIVICEETDEHAQVLAANYAFSLDAGLFVIPPFPKDDAEALLESLYSLYERPGVSPADALEQFKARLRHHAGALPLRHGTSVTFFTAALAWGFAFPEVPSTHFFNYPDLGIALINGIAAEQQDTPGIRTAVVIDPGSVDSKEIETARIRLTDTGVLTKALRSNRTTVYQAANTITLFPYDLLLISTHCGDVAGERRRYEFVDSEGRSRTLVVDIGVAFEIRRRGDDVKVTEFIRFVSLDGADWGDPERKKTLYVGTAINDFIERDRHDSLTPIKREEVPRVAASMALRLADGNYMFGGARGYIGTLFSVTDSEAQQVVDRLFGKYYGKTLAVALWRAQNDVYGDGTRRPYVLVGCHFQRLRTTSTDALSFVINELATAWNDWRRHLRTLSNTTPAKKSVMAMIEFLESELRTFLEFKKRRIQERRRT